MPTFSPETLAAWTGGRWTSLPATPPTGFTMDTRTLQPGQMFVALRTEHRDGHAFLGEAAAAGASAALVAAPQPGSALPQLVAGEPLAAFQAIAAAHRRQFRGPVIGVTGSAGKTSTKNLLALLLGGAGEEGQSSFAEASVFAKASPDRSPVLATRHNLNNHLGVPLTLTRLDPALHEFAVIEAGISAPGEMAPLAAMIQPDVAIVTLVAPAHLQALGSVEGVAREKAQLAAGRRAGGLAIFPASCAGLAGFRELAGPLLAVESAGAGPSPVPPPGRASFSFAHRSGETALTLVRGPQPEAYAFRRVSDGMTQNAALAICAARHLGVAREAIQSRLAAWRPAALRGELRRSGGRLLYLDCYNANPASMTDALAAFWSMAPAALPRIFVLGGMEELGAGSSQYHRELGRSLHLRPNDFLFVIGSEAEAVRGGALENGNRAEQIALVDSLEPVAVRLQHFAGAVFVKGSRKYALESLAGEAAHA
jgi:UDP-N-acetylmuramoyl-tripeptide--D-alanyl-D-alanine ligase